MVYLDEAKQIYKKGIARFLGFPQGCYPWEVEELESAIGFKLPAAYVEYLLWMGRDGERSSKGSFSIRSIRPLFSHDQAYVDDVVENEQILDGLLKHSNLREMAPSRMLVWWMHEVSDSFHFGLPAASEDPPCFRYVEGSRELKACGAFSECLVSLVNSYTATIRDLYRVW